MLRFFSFLFLFCVLSSIFLGYGLRVNIEKSLPFKLFYSEPFKEQNLKGMFIKFRMPVRSRYLVKEVVGVEGDSISVINDHVFINGKDVGKCLRKSPVSGSKLTPIQSDVVPSGYVYALAYHEHSFDSRYQEFGLIDQTQIKEVLWPIF